MALRARDETIGLLVVDNKFTKAPITHDDIDDLKTFAHSIAAAIDGKMLLRKTQNAERELRSLFRARSTLLSELERSTILHNVTEEARRVTGAASVSAALIDKNGDVQEMVTVGDLQGANVNEIIRSNGLSMRVVETGEPEKFENAAMERDRVNSIVIKLGIVAGLCVPLEIEGGRIGVMWYHYSQPHEFPRDRTETCRLYANQAVLAWDIARRMDHLKNLIERIDRSHRAAQAAARIAVLGENLQDSLNAIVEATKAVLNCDIVTLYPYDQKKKELGFPPAMVGVLKSDKVLHGGRVREGSMVPYDSGAVGFSLFRKCTSRRDIWKWQVCEAQKGIAAVGVPLQAGGRKVGVMFVSFRQPHCLDEHELNDIRLFANIAAAPNPQCADGSGLEGSQRTSRFDLRAIQWMEMVSKGWGHAIGGEVSKAQGYY